jgi:hypothetical protein
MDVFEYWSIPSSSMTLFTPVPVLVVDDLSFGLFSALPLETGIAALEAGGAAQAASK